MPEEEISNVGPQTVTLFYKMQLLGMCTTVGYCELKKNAALLDKKKSIFKFTNILYHAFFFNNATKASSSASVVVQKMTFLAHGLIKKSH